VPIKKVLRKIGVLQKKKTINTPDSALYKLEREASQARSQGTVLSERERLLLDKLVARRRKQISSRTKAVDRKAGNVILHGPYNWFIFLIFYLWSFFRFIYSSV